ncbi:Protein painting of fourth [Frankliniella fusca]|uniref:Protein painting of fourth n=1 Tax=Frankliniella fusca TaxID=407009 RepID=A0AAE1LK92_9NEOP|nr:Protein painting of fourth [Frankliniella fusca]
MYSNGIRFNSSGSKRKLENGADEASGVVPPKQQNYGESLNNSRAKQVEYADSKSGSSKQSNYGDYGAAYMKQASYNELLNATTHQVHDSKSSSRGKQHGYSDSNSSFSKPQSSNQSSYGEFQSSLIKQHSVPAQQTRDGVGIGASPAKPYISSNQYSYESLCIPPPPPPSQGPMQQFGFKQETLNQSGYQAPQYAMGPGRFGQHNGMPGLGRGWNQRVRQPMRGFRANQWPPPGPPPGATGPMVHPHMGHPGHLGVPPLLPQVPFHAPHRGYYGGHLGPRPPPLFGHQGNQHGGRNQGGHHQKSKNKKRQEESSGSLDANTNETSSNKKGGVLLTPEGKAKNKKKTAVQSFPSRPWNREDAEKALKVEVETTINLKNESLIIRFPDPELSRDIVKAYHPGIMNVHFQVPSGPRYCFVQLAPDVNTEKVIKVLENIKFGSGHLSVEKKSTKQEEEASPESIDPYTLYIGNLPTNVNIQTVKEKFPEAARVDVGFAQRMRYTRYAFIRFNSVDEAIKAYKENHNLVLDSRSIIVRFRRQKGQIDLPGESKPQQPSKVNVRTADTKKKEEEKKSENSKKETKPEDDDEKDEEEEEEDEEEDEEDNVDDDDDDDEDDGEGEAEDDDDDDDDDDGRKPLQDDDDDDDEDDKAGGPALPPDDDEDDDDDNIFRELDAHLGGYEGFPFNFN